MRIESSKFLLAATVLSIAGCATTQLPERAESPIQWGTPAGGLQMGIAGETSAVSPGQPQGAFTELEGVKVYLRNNGMTPIAIIDPTEVTTRPPAASSAPPPLVTIIAEPSAAPQRWLNRTDPPRVVALAPSQMVWFSVDLQSGSLNQDTTAIAAQYQNPDSEVTIAPPTGPGVGQKTTGLWTGRIRSGDLPLHLNP